MTEINVRAATESWLAENRMKEVQDYISRGRSLECTSIDELAGEWVSLIREWAADLRRAQDRRRADIEAEYQLRGLEKPYEIVKDELETILRTTAEAMENMDEDAKTQLNGDVLNFSAAEKRKAN
jgi:hypothetical protein